MEWFVMVLAGFILLPLLWLSISSGIKEAAKPEPGPCLDTFEKTPAGTSRTTRHKDLGPQIRK